MKLIEILKHFEEKITSGKTEMSDLTSEFKDLAPYFLYGGYIKVHQEYQIYIKTVEFYFHSEVTVQQQTRSRFHPLAPQHVLFFPGS